MRAGLGDLVRNLTRDGALAQVRLKLIRIFAGLLLASVTLIAVALWLGTLGRNTDLVEVDALVIGQSAGTPVLQYVFPNGEQVAARFADPVDPGDYPIGSATRIRVDPQAPDIAYEMPSGWPLIFAWIIGIPGVLLLISTLLLGRMVLNLARRFSRGSDDGRR